MADGSHSWKDILGDQPVNETRARLLHRLMEAEERIAQALYARGVEDEVIQAALDAVDARLSTEERRSDLYLASLAHFVRALDGRLEIRAVIGESTITLP